MMTATSINGPRTKLGKIIDPPTQKEVGILPADYNGGTDNPALIKHPDGRFLLYYRIKFPGLEGRNTYTVAIADKLEGPYAYHPRRVVNTPTYVEDPYIFVHGGVFHMLATDLGSRSGLLMTSDDGVSFDYDEGEKVFGPLSEYVEPEIVEACCKLQVSMF